MFILFQVPAFACGPDDAEVERSMWPAWEDLWLNTCVFLDVLRDPGMEGRYEWRPQRLADPEELWP